MTGLNFFHFMIRLLLLVVVLVPSLAADQPHRVSIVLYQGQQTTHTTRQSLTAVNFEDPAHRGVVKPSFQQYQSEVELHATKNGVAVIECQTVDGRVSEILDITVIPRSQYDLYRSVSSRFAGVDGVGSGGVIVAGRSLVVVGRAFKRDVLESCVDAERGGDVVCAIRLSPALAAIAPEVPVSPRASLDVVPAGEGWRLVIRVADVPIGTAESAERSALLAWGSAYVRNLNDLLRRWDVQSGETNRYPPVVSAKRKGTQIEISAVWNPGTGSRQDLLVAIPVESLAAVAVTARTSADLVASWWAAVLQDALRMYLLGERPARSTTATRPSPLIRLYEHALQLRGQGLDRDTARSHVARAAFALSLVDGEELFSSLPLAVPADLRE